MGPDKSHMGSRTPRTARIRSDCRLLDPMDPIGINTGLLRSVAHRRVANQNDRGERFLKVPRKAQIALSRWGPYPARAPVFVREPNRCKRTRGATVRARRICAGFEIPLRALPLSRGEAGIGNRLGVLLWTYRRGSRNLSLDSLFFRDRGEVLRLPSPRRFPTPALFDTLRFTEPSPVQLAMDQTF